jgi:GxxExxY protein
MPIELSIPIQAISKQEFHRIDRCMMAHAFAIHNRYGRLLKESMYQQELAVRCAKDGLEALREVLIRVRHGIFVKDYHLDLLLNGSTIVEAKVVNDLIAAHHGQGINYLLLAGVHHGSLVNFRPPRVDRRFLSTGLTLEIRQRFESMISRWPACPDHENVRTCLERFAADVGLGLDLPLYREAIETMAGCVREAVPILSDTGTIGCLEMMLVKPGVALAITSIVETDAYRMHLQKLLRNTSLEAVSWINLSLGQIHFDQLNK